MRGRGEEVRRGEMRKRKKRRGGKKEQRGGGEDGCRHRLV
jgi:hypothetical protein